jgi:anaerobic selenocysteine-containing dehydrogenase
MTEFETIQPSRKSPWKFEVGPPPEKWDDWVELDAKAWPKRKEKHFQCIPTICFNCESACGLLAFVDKEDGQVRKFEGNPVHPGSRGRTCAKGPATINQIQDPDRILKPLKRSGPRGSGQFEECTWEDALNDIGGRISKALEEDRHNEVMYHVGRPGDDHFVNRMLVAWGIDGHNSHTNVCSAATRLGFSLWCGADRPSPDFEQSKFILLISAHLETGHYFNPHAQRIIEAKEGGTRIGVIDTRLSNTASHAHHWVSSWPGSEPALLLAIAHNLLKTGRVNKEFIRRWCNWEDYLKAKDADGPGTFERFLELLIELYSEFTPEFVAEECKVPLDTVERLADEIAAAGTKFSSQVWRSAAAGNLGGWQVARSLLFLHVLTGSFGVPGGLNPNSWDKFVPKPSLTPPKIKKWNTLLWPKEFPLAHYEMSFLLPFLQNDQKTKLDVYFTRVYNPVWTNPGGASWIEMLEDEERVGLHIALTPIWSETAQWADYVLPMGLGSERHDIMSQETHAGTWIGFRQPVLREYERLKGKSPQTTLGLNPGEVWEEAEFWIALTAKIDPDGKKGILKYFESPNKPGSPMTLDEYYKDVFENSVPGLKEEAAKKDMDALTYMRRFGAYAVPYQGQKRYESDAGEGEACVTLEDGSQKVGFPTPTRKLEFYSQTMAEWGFGDQTTPGYIRSHVHWRELAQGEMCLLPTFRLPTLIHTRSGNAKWLQEISHTNPLWINPIDAKRLGIKSQELARVTTRIGYFVVRAWVTEGIHPGVVACSHHVGRWRLNRIIGGQRQASSLVDITRRGKTFLFRQKEGAGPYESKDPDTGKIWWNEVGVNQNLTFAVQPDPASGMHCWHQKVTVKRGLGDDRYGDVFVDTTKSEEAYREWMGKTRPGPGPDNMRRPLWLKRPLAPDPSAYKMS